MISIGLIVLSSLLYVVGYSLSTLLLARFGLTAAQVTFLRCALVLAAALAAAVWPRSSITWDRIVRPVRALEQRGTAAALVASNMLSILAYSLLQFTQASALSFLAPLMLTALGGFLLRERITAGRWFGAALGFIGMLLIVKPGTGASGAGILAAVGGASTYALYQVLVRRLRSVASSLDSAIQIAVVGVVLLAPVMVGFWRPLGWLSFGVVVLFTAVQTAALASLTAALRRGETSRLAPWQFTGLLWAMALDALSFGVMPSVVALFGGGLIIFGGVLAQGARRRRR